VAVVPPTIATIEPSSVRLIRAAVLEAVPDTVTD
jgi:hypothetical protein